MKEEKRAWIYCRIDALEDSIKNQKKELYDYEEQMCFDVTDCSEDLGSGLEYNRAGLREVIQAAGDGKMDVLLEKRFDRLGRDTQKTLEILQCLEQLNIRLYSSLEEEIQREHQNLIFFN